MRRTSSDRCRLLRPEVGLVAMRSNRVQRELDTAGELQREGSCPSCSCVAGRAKAVVLLAQQQLVPVAVLRARPSVFQRPLRPVRV
jgi:hypothetical protein